jgi:hypothetical protein
MMGYGPAIVLGFAIVLGLGDVASALRHMTININQTIKVQAEPTPPAKAGKTT